MKLSWAIPFPEGIAKRWLRRKNNAPDDVYFPRSPVQYYEPNDSIKLPAFGDASNHSVCAVVYPVVARCDTGSDCRQISPYQEKSDDFSLGARVRPHRSQLVHKCAGCTRRVQYDGGYTMMARQHCSPKLADDDGEYR